MKKTGLKSPSTAGFGGLILAAATRRRTFSMKEFESVQSFAAMISAASHSLAQHARSQLARSFARPGSHPHLQAKIRRRPRPLRFRSGRPRLHARRSSRPASLREAVRPLRHVARRTGPLRIVYQAHGQSRPRRLHRRLQRQERQLHPHHDARSSSTPSTARSTPKTTAKSTPTKKNQPMRIRPSVK